MGEIIYLVIEAREAKNGIGIAEEQYYLNNHWTNKKLFKGSFDACIEFKKRM